MSKVKTAIPSIRKKCLDCCSNSYKSVRECPARDCPLYPFRMGKRPKKEETVFEKRAQE